MYVYTIFYGKKIIERVDGDRVEQKGESFIIYEKDELRAIVPKTALVVSYKRIFKK